MGNKIGIIFTGLAIGCLALLLTAQGNPANMGVCIACFLRDTAGGLGLHQAKILQYIRPEILGIILGASILSITAKEFRSTGGSSRLLRFCLGFIMMIGMLIFLGCPLRVALRLGAGDLNAMVGFAGLFVGVAVGAYFLKSGFSLGKAKPQAIWTGAVLPIITLLILTAVILVPSLFHFSSKGPGSMHAPLLLALIAGLIIGVLAQRTRFCMAGGLRDLILFRNFDLLLGFFVIILVSLVGSLAFGNFKLGFVAQPIAHSEALWNFLGLFVAGWSAVLLGGCPLRQLILAGQGNSDAAITIIGLLSGAAFAHTFNIAASAKGVTSNGSYALIIAIVIILLISIIPILSTSVTRRENHANN